MKINFSKLSNIQEELNAFLFQEPMHVAIKEALRKDDDVDVYSREFSRTSYADFRHELDKVP